MSVVSSSFFVILGGVKGEVFWSGDNFTMQSWSVVGIGEVLRIEEEPINALMNVDLPELNSPATTAEKKLEEEEKEDKSFEEEETFELLLLLFAFDISPVVTSIAFLSCRLDDLANKFNEDIRSFSCDSVIKVREEDFTTSPSGRDHFTS